MGVKVTSRFKDENVDKMLRRLKKAIDNEGLAKDLAQHRFAQSRGQRRRFGKYRSAKRIAKEARLAG